MMQMTAVFAAVREQTRVAKHCGTSSEGGHSLEITRAESWHCGGGPVGAVTLRQS